MRRLPLVLLAIFAAAGCNPPPPPDVPVIRPDDDDPPPADALALAANSRGFAIDLYAQVAATEPGNVCVSPFSAHTALAMTAAGARGETLAEMQRVLRLPVGEGAGGGFANLFAALTGGGDGQGYEVRTANAIWAQAGYPWRPEFNQRVSRDFGAGLIEANFLGNPEGERARINAWAEQETRGRIKDLIAKDRITRDHRMVLANAVYFKGQWADAFDPKRTRPLPFTRADGTTTDVPMMNRNGGFRMYRPDGKAKVSVAEIPYRGGRVSMVILLPEEADGLPALEKALNPESLAGWLTAAKVNERAYLAIPKFRLEENYDLKRPLRALGMEQAFGPAADLTGLHTSSDVLFISFVVQKTFLDVNEEGTEAAAATAVGVMKQSAPPSFIADHPFVFLIRHVPTDTILFMGRYVGPKG
jgi:serpin B